MSNPFAQLCAHISELVPLDDQDKKYISERFEIKPLEKIGDSFIRGWRVTPHDVYFSRMLNHSSS